MKKKQKRNVFSYNISQNETRNLSSVNCFTWIKQF